MYDRNERDSSALAAYIYRLATESYQSEMNRYESLTETSRRVLTVDPLVLAIFTAAISLIGNSYPMVDPADSVVVYLAVFALLGASTLLSILSL